MCLDLTDRATLSFVPLIRCALCKERLAWSHNLQAATPGPTACITESHVKQASKSNILAELLLCEPRVVPCRVTMQVDQKHSSAAPSSPEARSSEASSETAGGRSNSKRKRSGKNLQPGPRTVQNLTKEQLERKRENDRQAQRAIRTRTKIHIKELQDELEALRQNGDPQRIAELVQERDRLVRENRALKEELQQRSDMNHSPAQVHPVETSSGGESSEWRRLSPLVISCSSPPEANDDSKPLTSRCDRSLQDQF